MAVYNIIPDECYDANDVRDTLNANGGNVGNENTSCFELSAGIDMWSKYKPIVDKRILIPLAEWKESGYRGDGKCGLTILSKYTSMSDFRQHLDNGTALWSYTPPNGDVTQPMRMDDFRGYNPKAVNPIGEIETDGYSENGDVDKFGDVDFSIDVSVDLENNLMLEDIFIEDSPLTEFYLGIYAWKSDSSWFYKTAMEPIGANYNLNVTIPLVTGEWKVTPFFSSVPQDSIEGDEQEGVFLGANIKTKSVTIISTNDKVVFTVHGVWNSSKTAVQDIYVFVKNNTSADVTLDNIGVELRAFMGTEEKNVGNPSVVYYKGRSDKVLTVPANSEVITEVGNFGSIKLGDANDGYSYYLNAYAYSGDTHYSHTYGIEEMER